MNHNYHNQVTIQPLTTARHPHFQGLATVGVGDLVRDQVKRGTAVGKQLKVRDINTESTHSSVCFIPAVLLSVSHLLL